MWIKTTFENRMHASHNNFHLISNFILIELHRHFEHKEIITIIYVLVNILNKCQMVKYMKKSHSHLPKIVNSNDFTMSPFPTRSAMLIHSRLEKLKLAHIQI